MEKTIMVTVTIEEDGGNWNSTITRRNSIANGRRREPGDVESVSDVLAAALRDSDAYRCAIDDLARAMASDRAGDPTDDHGVDMIAMAKAYLEIYTHEEMPMEDRISVYIEALRNAKRKPT